ncbi:MAG TPA: PhnD/SsuA/transferrin family substrate-binding protein [Ferrovibrio sp.]|uniref:ABC transporter substrate-binding protein n=1 Tax=Ferrovibrio sp. TaxID=1917215 RepID=UPI002B4B646B|nr:PhnD/SsuA/transferrin family substrate-binding protein [Ferrovibrio sp.]HLT76346.1 PhnD/SsuA/transferrin family substrate-binding protein [Ferrovibrio sp.]
MADPIPCSGPAISRRSLLAGAGATLALSQAFSAIAEAPRLAKLTIWGPPAGPSVTLIHAIASGLLEPLADAVSFRSWRSPDELRAGLTSQTMDVFILPTQTAANLYNRGLGVRLLNVLTDGLLHMVAVDRKLASIPSLRGRSISVPFRNDTPEVIFRRLLQLHGLDPEKDLAVSFSGTPVEAIQLLVTGRVDAAVLPEPAATLALSGSKAVTRDLFRTIDIQQAWHDVTGLGTRLPQAGIGVTERFLADHAGVAEALHAGLVAATASVNADPARAAADSAAELWMPAPIIERSIPFSNLVATRARDARPALEAVFRSVAEFDDRIIGGKLPAADFYL